jgi:1-acyl-sn-glycerol-3-phosphate acyltransferase
MINVLHYILIPFKIILFVILIILGINILKHTNSDSNITTLIIVFYKFVVHYLMSYNIEISDEDYNKYMKYLYSDEKFLCVFNHISTVDGFALLSTFPKIGFVLNKQKILDYINYDDIVNDKVGGIFVDMEKKTDVTSKIKNAIYNRKSGGNIIFISPSAGEISDEVENIGYFKRNGAFISKSNILPILIKLPDYSIIYNMDNEKLIESFTKLFLPENYTIKIKVGDMIYANDDESIEEYKDRVYNIMNREYKELKV